jgi:hypothetical protein
MSDKLFAFNVAQQRSEDAVEEIEGAYDASEQVWTGDNSSLLVTWKSYCTVHWSSSKYCGGSRFSTTDNFFDW